MISQLTEKVNFDIAEKLSKINYKQFEILFNHSKTKRHDDYNLKNEFSKLKTYCKLIVATKNNNNVEYDYPENKKVGRLQSKSPSLQRIYNGFRGILCNGKMIDLDMKNCHPVILLNLCKEHNIKYNYLLDYISNRDNKLKEVMKQYNISRSEAKSALLSCLNDINVKTKICKKKVKKGFLNNFDGEMSKIIFELFHIYKDNKKYSKYISNEDYNIEGKFTNLILCNIENKYLNMAINSCINNNLLKKEDIAVLMFDGFMIYDNNNTDEIINLLNKDFFEYNIEWDTKEHNIELLDKLKTMEIKDVKLYHEVKQIFEKDHFRIEHPLLYGRTYVKNNRITYGLYNKNDYRDLVKKNIYVYQEVIETEEGVKYKDRDIFDDWIRDTEIRSYKNINFVPKLTEENNLEYFNTFTGFDADFINNYTNNEKAIELFYKHLSLLTNHNTKSVEYLINYIADIIQNPDKLPSVAIVFKSKQGFGKDLLLDIISRILGNKFLYRTANLEEVFGSFNTSIKDKIILQLNELEGKDGFSKKEKIKNLITEEITNINEKKITAYPQNNCLRIFIMSNNISPLEIPHDDRRFVVFKAHFQKPDKDYFKQLVDLKNSNDDIKTLYEYLKNYKIKLNLREDRPLTVAYKEMQENCTNPIYNYLNELFIRNNIDEYYDEEEYKTHKKSGNILIKSNDFYQNYKNYLLSQELEFIKTNFKLVKSLLADIEINKRQIKINNENSDYYVFNKDKIKEHLKHMNLEEDILEYNDDDFE